MQALAINGECDCTFNLWHAEAVQERSRALFYQPHLDGLRFFAASLVIAYHAGSPVFGGYIGVDVFFVLSGFLITRMLEMSDGLDLRSYLRFQARRAARILPLMIVYFLVVILLASTGLLVPLVNGEISLFFLLMTDILRAAGKFDPTWGHLWTISAELKFYLIWPLIWVFIRKLNSNAQLWVLIAGWLSITALEASLLSDGWDRVYYGFDVRFSGFVAGSIAALVSIRVGRVSAWLSAVLIFAVSLLLYRGATVEFLLIQPFIEFGTCLLILGGTALSILSWRPIVHAGVISYGVYVWHLPIMELLPDSFSTWTLFGATLVLAMGSASLSYHLLEKPVRSFVVKKIAV